MNLVYLLPWLAILGQLGRLPVWGGVGVGSVYLLDVAVVVTVVGFFGLSWLRRRPIRLPSAYLGYLFFLLVGGLSLVNQVGKLLPEEILVAGFYWCRALGYSLLLVVAANLADQGEFRAPHWARVVVGAAVVLALAGLVQLLILPDFARLDPALGWDPHRNRLSSTFFDPNFTGAFLVLSLVSFLFGEVKFSPKIRLVVGGLLLLAIILTFSRSAYLMLAVALLLIGWQRDKRLVVATLVLGFSAYYFVPRIQTRLAGITDPADSARLRLVSWSNAVEIFDENPLIGVGFNAYRYVQEQRGYFDYRQPLGNRSGAGADSSLLFVLATTGVLGFGGYLLFWLGLITSRRLPSYRRWLLLALILESSFINSLFYPPIMVWVFLEVGRYL